MTNWYRLSLCLVAGGCASAGAVRRPGNGVVTDAQADVVQRVEQMFDAMRARDTATLRAMILPDARFVAASDRGDTATARAFPVDAFIRAIGASAEVPDERMWDPVVQVDGNVAALWAPYKFHAGKRFSHCGHNAVHLVRVDGEWRVSAITYSMRETGC